MRNRPVPQMSDEARAFARSLLIAEDALVLAFNKPSGLPVQSRGNNRRCLDELLWAFARSNGKRPRLVHRLDAATSGLILAARTKPAAAFLSAAFEAREVEKHYLALVSGNLPVGAGGTVDEPLRRVERGEDGRPAHARASRPGESGAKPARTDWQAVASGQGVTLLDVQPQTGRMHQIRAHLAHIGHPIIGDKLYEGGNGPRLMLHAARLTVPLPEGGTRTYEAPPQADFTDALKSFGL
jgi:tRNA pseudouridine32 synthase/23S rRNA pseudouridine746 synthase